MYYRGEGISEDDAEALKWYRKSANQGFAKAQVNLGMTYDNGEGIPENDVKAYSWWSVAKAQGHKKARSIRCIPENRMTKEQIAGGQALAAKCW